MRIYMRIYLPYHHPMIRQKCRFSSSKVRFAIIIQAIHRGREFPLIRKNLFRNHKIYVRGSRGLDDNRKIVFLCSFLHKKSRVGGVKRLIQGITPKTLP